MENYDSPEIINVGVGEDIRISELAELIRGIVEFDGEIVYRQRQAGRYAT